ncbi:MAG: hypothetical protein ABI605_01925 [Rhizobacter sp.]
MNTLHIRLATLALAVGAVIPAWASSTAASSASEGGSASVGSVSDSFEKSSDSSSTKNKTAAGDYKVIDVAAVAERPGTLRMKLQPVADSNEDNAFFLYLPEKALAQSPIAAGQIVSARDRPYGVEFAKADTGKAFFLVLQDDWYRELQSNAVTL